MPFSSLGAGIFAVALPIVLAGVIVALGRDRGRVRRAALAQWQGYLGCVDQSLRNLTAMQTALESLAQEMPDARSAEIGEPVRRIVSAEIQALRRQLDQFISLSDFLFSSAPIEWRPFPPLANEMRGLVQQAVRRYAQSAEGRREMEKQWRELDGHIGSLRTRNDSLGERIRELAEGLSTLADTGRPEGQPQAGPTPPNEEAMAARLLGDLPASLTLEELESRVAETEKELEQRRIEQGAATDPAQHKRIQGRMEWLLQVKRWWRIQQRLRHQENLLLESQGELEKIADADYRERFRQWLQSASLREENAEIAGRLTALTVEKRTLEGRLQATLRKQPALETLLGAVAQVQELQTSNSGAVGSLDRALHDLRSAIAILDVAEGSDGGEESVQGEVQRKQAQQQQQRIADLAGQLDEVRLTFEKERAQFRQTLTIMSNALEMATVDKRMLEGSLRQSQESTALLKERLARHDPDPPAGE